MTIIMKFIVETFGKKERNQIAEFTKGEIVHENETLVIVEAENEEKLFKDLDQQFDFPVKIEEMKTKALI